MMIIVLLNARSNYYYTHHMLTSFSYAVSKRLIQLLSVQGFNSFKTESAVCL